MTVLDNKIVPKVLAVLNKYGVNATFTAKYGTYNATTGYVTGGSADPKVWKIAPPAPYDRFMIDGDLIRAEDLRTTIAASGITFTPETGMKVTYDSKTYTIVNVTTLRSGDSIAAYELQLRK